MARIMHDALHKVKCQLHHGMGYDAVMGSMADRLKSARMARGFATAKDAAEKLGFKVSTYIQHENGTRAFSRERAVQYARSFKSTPEWLLYGRGKAEQSSLLPATDEMEAMIRDVLSEIVTVDTKLADLPRIFAPALLEQLELYQADRAASDQIGLSKEQRTAAQLPAPTKLS